MIFDLLLCLIRGCFRLQRGSALERRTTMITKRDRMNLLEQEINTMFDNISWDTITEKECEPILEILGQLREEVQKVLLIHLPG